MYVQGMDQSENLLSEEELEMYNAEYEVFVPDEVCISLKQGESAAVEPVVKIGDHVSCGQLIGTSTSDSAIPVYASISGTVINIFEKKHSVYEMVSYIVIRSDRRRTVYPADLWLGSWGSHHCLKNIGIVAMMEKHISLMNLSLCKGRLKEICLAAYDREPMVYSDYRLLIECPSKVLLGARILAEAFDIQTLAIYVCHDEIRYVLEKTIHRYSQALHPLENIRFFKVPMNMYKKSCIPLETKECTVWCSAVEFCAVYDGYYDGRPMTSRGITVSGKVKNGKNLWVPNGTYVRDLVAYCGGVRGVEENISNKVIERERLCVVEGGPLKGHCVDVDCACVSLITESILILPNHRHKEEDCLLCRNCCSVCPMDLKPLYIEKSMKDGPDLWCLLDVDRCIECGWCSYVCPSHHSLKEKAAAAKKLSRNSTAGYGIQGKKYEMEAGREMWDYIDLDISDEFKLEPLIPASQSGPYIHNAQSRSFIESRYLAVLTFMAVVYTMVYGPSVLLKAGMSAIVLALCDWMFPLFRKHRLSLSFSVRIFLKNGAVYSIPWKTALIDGITTALALSFIPSWRWLLAAVLIACGAKYYLNINSSLAGIALVLCARSFAGGVSEISSFLIALCWILVWLYMIYEMLILPWASLFFFLVFQWFYILLGGTFLLSPMLFMTSVWFVNDYKNGGKDTPLQRLLSIFAGLIAAVLAVIFPGGAGICLGVLAINIIACNLMSYTI